MYIGLGVPVYTITEKIYPELKTKLEKYKHFRPYMNIVWKTGQVQIKSRSCRTFILQQIFKADYHV